MKLSDRGKNFLLVMLLLTTSFCLGRSYGINSAMKLYDPVIESSRSAIDKLKAQLKEAKYTTSDVEKILQFCTQNNVESAKITDEGIMFVLTDGSVWISDDTGFHKISGERQSSSTADAFSA